MANSSAPAAATPAASATPAGPAASAIAADVLTVAALILVVWAVGWLWGRGTWGQILALLILVALVATVVGPRGQVLWDAAQSGVQAFGNWARGSGA